MYPPAVVLIVVSAVIVLVAVPLKGVAVGSEVAATIFDPMRESKIPHVKRQPFTSFPCVYYCLGPCGAGFCALNAISDLIIKILEHPALSCWFSHPGISDINDV